MGGGVGAMNNKWLFFYFISIKQSKKLSLFAQPAFNLFMHMHVCYIFNEVYFFICSDVSLDWWGEGGAFPSSEASAVSHE